MSMFCSAVIPTIGRATLSRAVHSVLNQEFHDDDFEVIVVNDTGEPLPEMDWHHSVRARIITTQKRERSVARNTGAAVARGRYLYFLDDDDVMLPGALKEFWKLSQKTDAEWLFGSYQTVDNKDNLIAEIHAELAGNIFAQLVAGEGIPLGASLFSSDKFFEVGMFDADHVEEVRDLGRRIAFEGNIVSTAYIVHKIRIGEQGSSTNWSRLPENDRWGREKALNLRNSFSRLCLSADASTDPSAGASYWRGRVSRAYFASMFWNLKRKNILIAMSRAIFGLALTSWHFLSVDYWNGFMTIIKW